MTEQSQGDDLTALRQQRDTLNAEIERRESEAVIDYNERLDTLAAAIETYATAIGATLEESTRKNVVRLLLGGRVRIELGYIDGQYGASFSVYDLSGDMALVQFGSGLPSAAALIGLIAGTLGHLDELVDGSADE